MKIICDTREQRVLSFKHKSVTEVIETKLDCGDYCAQWENGDMAQIIFERKTIEDLFGTLSNGYERFKKEITRAQDKGIKLIIIIEGTFTDVLLGCKYSARNPDSLTQQLFTLMLKYGVSFVCCASRYEMSRYIIEYYAAVKRLKNYEKSLDKKE